MITLKDLADLTGFSITTISRVLNNDKTLRATEETKNIIKTIADASGYKTLRTRKKEKFKKKKTFNISIGIIEMENDKSKIEDPYYLYLKRFLEKICLEKDITTYNLEYNSSKKKYISENIKKISGIIALGNFTLEKIESMKKINKNIVFLDTYSPDENFSSISPDLVQGVKSGVDYLIKNGHKKICFVGPVYAPNLFGENIFESRREAFIQYSKKLGNKFQYSLLECERTEEDARKKLFNFLEKKNPLPDCFFSVNESVAIGLLTTLKELKIKVPDEVSILSYNNTVFSSLTSPKLSSIMINSDYMAYLAVDLIIKQLSFKNFSPTKIFCSSQIVEKESIKLKLE